jgi:lipopolysaccharide export system protein LptA
MRMVERLARIAMAAILVALPTAAAQTVASSGPATPARRPLLQITAETIRVDAQTQVAIATGRVRVTDGTTTAEAARGTVYRREGRGVLRGNVRVVGPQGVLEGETVTVEFTTRAITRVVARGAASLEAEGMLVTAQVVTIVPAADSVTAERAVTLFVPPDIIATGPRLVYVRARGMSTLVGRWRVQTPEGFIEADRVEVARRGEQAVAIGSVHGVFRETQIHSQTATLYTAEKKAVFAGGVRLTQPDRLMTTERVTVWYGLRRVLAEGQTTIRIEPPP